MAVLKSLTNLLEKNKIKHEVIDHKKTYTALDTAETQHLKPQEIVKTLVIKLNARKYILALIPSNKNLNKAKLKKEVNKWLKKEEQKTVKTVEFAKEAWMKKNLKGKLGATPPFGSLMKLPTFIDRILLRQKNLIINTGDYQKSIKLATKKFLEAEEMIKGNFSEAKKKIKKARKTKNKK